MNNNSYVIIKKTDGTPDFAIEASGDRLIIEEDKFRTGTECKTCDGEGHLNVECPNCKGTKLDDGEVCRACFVRGVGPIGYEPCTDCRGAGGLIVAPDTAKMRPTSGTIRSVGRDANTDDKGRMITESDGTTPWLKIGDRVIYALFAGTAMEFKQRGVCRILHKNEIIGKLYGLENVGKFVR